MVAITSHDNCAFEFIDDCFLEFTLLGCLVSISSPSLSKAFHLFIDELETVIHRKILGDIVNDQIETSLEYPRGGEEAWPGLDCVVKDLCFRAHEESWVSSNLTKIRVSHLLLNDRIYEIQGKWMVFHLHLIQLV